MRDTLLASALLLCACASSTDVAPALAAPAQTPAPAVAAAANRSAPNLPTERRGYLDHTAYPNSLALLPPPPAEGSPAFAADEGAREAAQRYRDTPRWALAASDADLRNIAGAIGAFSCAANAAISPRTTPRTFALLGKTALDVGLSTYAAKNQYQRMRPFVMHSTPTCLPADEPTLRNDGSYPSGHSALGWGWALVLAELFPDRDNEILQRGRDFGQSRVVCNAHWQSDVDAGRVIASATVARLHADSAFQADLAAARAELAAVNTTPDANSCATEASALRVAP
jgi:acid phosphatase (class A)